MKKIIGIALLCAGTITVNAQKKSADMNPIKGWWVVESNVNSPQKQLVKFYNDSSQLIYEESYEKKVLKYAKKRTRAMLDSALVAVLKSKADFPEAANIANVIGHKH